MPTRRYSKQRELIFEALRQTDEHPTAEMLYRRLKPQNPALSLGTVYRNMKLLSDEGRVWRLSFPVERYDAIIEQHPHFCCRACGAVSDLALGQDETLDRRAAQSGHEIHGHELVFYGICKHCRA